MRPASGGGARQHRDGGAFQAELAPQLFEPLADVHRVAHDGVVDAPGRAMFIHAIIRTVIRSAQVTQHHIPRYMWII